MRRAAVPRITLTRLTVSLTLLGLSGCNGCPPHNPSAGDDSSGKAPLVDTRTQVHQQIAGITVVDIIPFSLSGEANQDSEPFLAIHPKDPNIMVISAFTPAPGAAGSAMAPLFLTRDGGANWGLTTIVPSPSQTHDITHAFDSSDGNLFAGILRSTDDQLEELTTPDATSPNTMKIQSSRGDDDQPFVRVLSVAPNHRVYVGNNDASEIKTSGHTATIDLSLNGGQAYSSVRIEKRPSADISGCYPGGHQDGPSVRPTIAKDGTVYAAFFGWRTFTGNCFSATVTSDVVVVRDDHGGTGTTTFEDLKDDTDHQVGALVERGVTIPWSNGPTLAQERVGSTLSLAVDPNDSKVVYIVWGDRIGNGDIYSLHLRKSTDRGQSWPKPDLVTISNATNGALAVADDGTAAFLYQQLTGSGGSRVWETHLVQSKSQFASCKPGAGTTSCQDIVLAATPAASPKAPSPQFLPYLGDYVGLLAVGKEFRGVFSAANLPVENNFPQGWPFKRDVDRSNHKLRNGVGGTTDPSIDPFYFSAPTMP
jgi:hypothetical protein